MPLTDEIKRILFIGLVSPVVGVESDCYPGDQYDLSSFFSGSVAIIVTKRGERKKVRLVAR